MQTDVFDEKTVFALSTPVGGAIAAVRLSGPGAGGVLRAIFSGRVQDRYLAHGRILDNDRMLDEVMAAFIAGPNSYTGEDMAEIYCHGGAAVVQGVLSLLSRYARPARPGEFTERAFLNGRMDLSRAEAVMDVINAQAEWAGRAALCQLEGALGRRIAVLEGELLDMLSGIDAAIDYPEELEEDTLFSLPQRLAAAQEELLGLVSCGLRSRVLREGASIVLLGRPNAGKSSLLNALLGRERAIVTDIAGTTRDTLEEPAQLLGLPVRLTDTAGLHETQDAVESIGISRAREAAGLADLLLIVLDGGQRLSKEDEALLAETAKSPRLVVICKSDLPALLDGRVFSGQGMEALTVSAHTGEGLSELKRAIAERIALGLGAGESALVTNSRHIAALQRASEALKSAQHAKDPDCTATDIRAALIALGEITGSSVDEETIERIFSQFCVGK